MANEKQLAAQQASTVLTNAATTFSQCDAVGKIDWMKLFELLMQFLPLILTFFKPKEETPKA